MTRMQYNWIMSKQFEPREDPEGLRGISNFTGRIRGMHIFVGNFTYVLDFVIVEDISSIIDPRNEEDKKRGVDYVMNKILRFYKECLELGPKYLTGLEESEERECMTRSSTKELLTPFKEPEQEFRSSRKLFKTLSLDESRSPIDLFSNLEENSEEEVAETMAETMEQYMSKT
ncbi:hypothetical protein Tco_1360784 [Tanacetum coccineum]